jgi:integrase
MTSETLLEEWVSWLRGAGFRRASTAAEYRLAVRNFIRLAEVTDLATVKTAHLDEYVNLLLLDRIGRGTIRTRLFALRSFFEWATSRELLPKNPAAPGLFRIPADDRGERPVFVLEPAELQRLFDAAAAQRAERGKREPERFFARRVVQTAGQAERDHALLMVAYSGALRVSEVAALRWEHVTADRRDGSLRIMLPASKRSDYPATIYLDTKASRALLSWRRARAAAGRRGSLVFGISAKACADVFDRVARLAGIPSKLGRRPTFHALRSSRATHASEGGLTDREVADLLRHRNLDSITRYVRAATETRRRTLALSTLPWNARTIGKVQRGSRSVRLRT